MRHGGIWAPRTAVGTRRVRIWTPRASVGALRALVRAPRVALARSWSRVRSVGRAEITRLWRALSLDLTGAKRGSGRHRSRGCALRRGHDTRRRRGDGARPRAVATLSLVTPALAGLVRRAGSFAPRRARRDHGALDRLLGRTRRAPTGRDVARRVGLDAKRRPRRLESPCVDLRDARLLHGAATEVVLADSHDGVLDGGVLVDVDVGDVHDRRAIGGDVIDDTRT